MSEKPSSPKPETFGALGISDSEVERLLIENASLRKRVAELEADRAQLTALAKALFPNQ